ncbi:MAG: STAS domain-containing protein [Burkholderiales bacterium]
MMTNVNLTRRNYASAMVLTPTGRLDHDNCEAFREALQPYLQEGGESGGGIVFDLSTLEYVSSAGLRCLMIAAKEAKTLGSTILIAAMQPVVAEIFQISRFNLVFDTFPTVREALNALSPESAAAYGRD